MIDQRTAAYGALLLRLSLGTMWVAHALLKYFVFSIAGFAGFLESQGLPAFMAWPVFLMELAGGILIILGVYTRQVALLLLPVLDVAGWTHLPNGWVFTNAGGGYEYPLFLIASSFAVALLGDGALALRSARLWPGAAALPAK